MSSVQFVRSRCTVRAAGGPECRTSVGLRPKLAAERPAERRRAVEAHPRGDLGDRRPPAGFGEQQRGPFEPAAPHHRRERLAAGADDGVQRPGRHADLAADGADAQRRIGEPPLDVPFDRGPQRRAVVVRGAGLFRAGGGHGRDQCVLDVRRAGGRVDVPHRCHHRAHDAAGAGRAPAARGQPPHVPHPPAEHRVRDPVGHHRPGPVEVEVVRLGRVDDGEPSGRHERPPTALFHGARAGRLQVDEHVLAVGAHHLAGAVRGPLRLRREPRPHDLLERPGLHPAVETVGGLHRGGRERDEGLADHLAPVPELFTSGPGRHVPHRHAVPPGPSEPDSAASPVGHDRSMPRVSVGAAAHPDPDRRGTPG